ncbi:YdjY domain-containing protein [bacterium]|nr:YdjY domain-containing protein [bacterium]
MKTISCKILAFVFLVLLTAPAVCSDQAAAKSVRKSVALPGLVVDFKNNCVDLDARICLDAGYLELIACTNGSKEHESIVSVSSKALHIHTALLLLGADNGHPEMRKLVDEENQRWVNLSPRGDPIEVMLVVKNSDGKSVEKPICEFVVRSAGRLDEVGGDVRSDPSENAKQNAGKSASFSKMFLFAGSRLRDAGAGPKQYLADFSGNVISIATFGDEVLCLPSHQTQKNNALMWQVKPSVLPKVGTKVTLRLRPMKNVPCYELKNK